MIKPLIFTLLSAFLFTSLTAQKDIRKGYIIDLQGDTVHGMIDFQGDMNNSTECIFYGEKAQPVTYKPFDIQGYRFNGGKFYVSKKVEANDTVFEIFAEYIVDATKDLFYYRDMKGFHYLISFDDSTLVEIPYEEKVIRKNGEKYLYESTKHIGYLKTYFADCPEIIPDIETISKPERKNLTALATKYHEITCGDTGCIVYEKPKTGFRIGFEPMFSSLKLSGIKGYNNQYGGLLYFWMPRANENLFLKTGILKTELSGGTELYRIPLKLEYVFPRKIIQPKLGAGINIYTLKIPEYQLSGETIMLAASGGFLIKLNEHFKIDIDFETDIVMLNYKTDLFMSHSLRGGLIIMI